MTAPKPEADQPAQANEIKNENPGTMTDSVQAGIIDTCNIYSGGRKTRFVARTASADELEKARTFFVPPANFHRAEAVLHAEKVVILVGNGCGRRYAGLRLLVEQSYGQIQWLDPDRALGSVDSTDVQAEHGYLWDLCGTGNTRPFTEADFTHIRGLVNGTPRCGLVIVLDQTSVVPSTAVGVRVELGPPDAFAIAEHAINHSPACEKPEIALDLLRADLAEFVTIGTSPENAQYAAELAMRVAAGELDVTTAKHEFHEGLDSELARIMEGPWTSMQYTMMCAVALLHDEPFEDVVAAQWELDDKIRTAELPADKEFRPRRTFFLPNDHLFKAIGAVVEDRENPSLPDLRMQTVRFARSGWVDVVLPRIWQNYHIEHGLLMDWMCGPAMATGNFGAAVRALTSLIRHVPARDRLGELDKLAANGGVPRWRLAAATLARLENTDDLGTVAAETLEAWVSGSPHRKCAAIVYYGYRFDEEPEDSIAKLADIARDPSPSVHNIAVGTLLGRLKWSDKQDLILRSMVAWLDDPRPRRRDDGLQDVVLDLSRYLLRLADDMGKMELPVDPLTLISDYPNHCRRLIRNILNHPDYGKDAVKIMARLAMRHWYFRDEDKYRGDMVPSARLLELLAPRLRWWSSRRLRTRLVTMFPEHASQIPRIFRSARGVYRAGSESVSQGLGQ
ncbi:MAG TPA: hypothetical protein VHZ97_16635 [Pseudonocardiaceae bacterium]|jgi:hypothetical protein|nr:hypothetical protein [Pseudonocardiaceae bacterium]